MAPSAAVTTTVCADSHLAAAAPLDLQRDDFFWAYTEEPHKTRRQAIIKAHPEVRDLQNAAASQYD